MILVPPPSVSHTVVYHWRSLISPGWGLAEAQSGQRGTGSSGTALPLLVFLSPHLFGLSWHVTMYGPQGHSLAVRRLLVDSLLLGVGRAAARTLLWLPLVENTERLGGWRTNTPAIQLPLVLAGTPKGTVWPVATQPGVSAAEKGKETRWQSLVRSLEFSLHHGQKSRKDKQAEILNSVPGLAMPWLANGSGENCPVTQIRSVRHTGHHLEVKDKESVFVDNSCEKER